MKPALAFLFGLLVGTSALAAGAPTQMKLQLENQIRDRVLRIVEKADPKAIVQVTVNLKKISSDLPFMGMGANVVPLEYDGALGASSIQDVVIRVVTSAEELPEWLRAEVGKAVKLDGVNTKISYEKGAGTFKDPAEEMKQFLRNDVYSTFKETSKAALDGIKQLKIGMWGLIAAIVLPLLLVAMGIFGMARRLEISLARVIEEKVVPALAQNRGAGNVREKSRGDEDRQQAPMQTTPSGGPGGNKELADLPHETLLSLLSDCYWTKSDGYAHYLWSQMTQQQKETILGSKAVDIAYLSYIRQFEAVNLNYHLDARYLLLGADFRSMSQDDLAQWLRKNTKEHVRITPLRWDLLPLSLAERIQFSQMPANPQAKAEPLSINVKSRPRVLPMKLEVKQLSSEDEEFIWTNSASIPGEVRPALKTLAWFALAPLEYRQNILSDLDARGLAEAWLGPAPILEQIKEALPAKKLEMLEHFLKEVKPDRGSDVFAYLVDAGLNAPVVEAQEQDRAAA